MTIKFSDVAAQWQVIKKECLPKIEKFLESGNYIGNSIINEFENNFANYIGCKHAVGVSNGTNALKLSIQSLSNNYSTNRVCVIIPANTFISNALAASYFNYDIKLIDCDEFYGMKVEHLHAWFAGKRENYDKVIVVPVHLYGYPANIQRIKDLCTLYDARIIEDCSQAHGAMIKTGKVGNFGELGVFSCYASKNLGAAGEGALITTNESLLYESLKELRDLGSYQKNQNNAIGWNDRPQAIQFIILNEKLKYLDEWNNNRSYAAEQYNKQLKDLPIVLPVEPHWSTVSVYHLYVIRTEQRDKLQQFLNKKDIQTGIHYPIPIGEQKLYKKDNLTTKGLINTMGWKDKLLSLPMHPFLTENEIDYVCNSIKEFYDTLKGDIT
tara:strand:+ start:319 stop:1464 length:1146 start_codon:yes stop_codon:yes gene_type:complete